MVGSRVPTPEDRISVQPHSRVIDSSFKLTKGLEDLSFRAATANNIAMASTLGNGQSIDPQLFQFLKSNDLLPDAVAAKVKEMLREPMEAISTKELELQHLEHAIQKLRKEKETISNFTKPYVTMLAPIRRIPPELLLEIFQHCLPVNRPPIMDDSEAPVLLTHICSSWRFLAISFQRLWAKIFISIPTPPPPDFQSDPNITVQMIRRYEHSVMQRSKVVDIWLERSGDCPLSISLVCTTSTSRGVHPWMKKILDDIIHSAHRWDSAELVVSYNIYSRLENSISPEDLGNLKTFKLKISQPPVHDPSQLHNPQQQMYSLSTLLGSSNIYSLSISWPAFTREIRYYIPSTWSQLRHLFLHSDCPSTSLVPLLSQFQNLSDCRIWISNPGNDDLVPGNRRTAFLPHLKTFMVHDTSINVATGAAFKAIRAPVLNRVGYTRSFGGHLYDGEAGSHILKTQLSSFCDLLTAAPIDKFMLALAYQSSKMISDFLLKVPNIKHLIVGQKPLPFRQSESTGNPVAQHSWFYVQRPLPKLNQFDLRTLTVSMDFSPSPDYVAMLPNLEILEVYGISDLSDDNALELLRNRLDASQAGRVARLQSVKLYFDREMERDITQDVELYASTVGHSLDIELVYQKAKGTLKYANPLSSSFGLSTPEGLSWAGTVEYNEFQ